MEAILLPSKISYAPGSHPREGILTIEPCYYGYGTTIGNALRRVLLSSLPGAAVTAVKIKGVTHEFQPIQNVKEDALEIILNLKQLRLKSFSEQPVKLFLRAKGERVVTAADVEANADVEIVNPHLPLATLTDPKAEFEMELTVSRGRGFLPTEERGREGQELGTIAIDALFSPIRNVGYRVENTRVGDITNYDKLIMTIETDGTIELEDAVKQSAQILIDHFALFQNMAHGAGEASASVLTASQAETAPSESEPN